MDTITEDLCMDLKETKALIEQIKKTNAVEKDLLGHYIDSVAKSDTNHLNVMADVNEMNSIANSIAARKERIKLLKELYKTKKKMYKLYNKFNKK